MPYEGVVDRSRKTDKPGLLGKACRQVKVFQPVDFFALLLDLLHHNISYIGTILNYFAYIFKDVLIDNYIL